MRQTLRETLVDARAQVKAALEGAKCSVPFAVRQRYPDSLSDGVTVTYGEYSNTSTQWDVVDQLIYQVDVWAFDWDTLRALAQAVNGAMTGLGLRRMYASPDAALEDGSGYLRKTYRFGRKVDKRTMRLVD